jgi:hypothetical protein
MGVGLMSNAPELKSAFKLEGGPLIAILFEVIALMYVWLANGMRCCVLVVILSYELGYLH